MQAEHAARVRAAVEAALVAGGGWLPFEEYLRIVLYAPGLGYYSAGAQKFGAAGDFTTAPELSPLFGRCLARAVAPVLAATGGGLLEFGAGSGRLAATLLAGLAELGAAPRHYWILEVSAELRARQRALLGALPPALAGCVEWLDTLPASPLEGVILANEVADALPFGCFALRDSGPMARGVALDEQGALAWAERPADSALRSELARIESELEAPLPSGYVSELCPGAGGWVAALGAALGRGVALVIDYGVGRREYYHPARAQGRCAATTGTARTRIRSCIPGCRTLPPGWISRAWPKRRSMPASRSPATAPRPRSCWRAASRRTWPPGSTSATARAVAARRASCCCPARWGRPSKCWP